MTAPPLTPEETRDLQALLRTVDIFADADPLMPLQELRTFLFIALKEGLGTLDLSRETGINNTVMSRHLQDLGELNRHQRRGLNWVYQKIDVRDRRSRKAYLTPAGISKRHAILRALQR